MNPLAGSSSSFVTEPIGGNRNPMGKSGSVGGAGKHSIQVGYMTFRYRSE